jgi:hypothetical protein
MTDEEQREADEQLRADLTKAYTFLGNAITKEIAEACEDLRSEIEGLRELLALLTERVEEIEAAQ